MHVRQLIKFLSVEARRAGKLRKKLATVEQWLRQRRISQTITHRIRAYYAEVWLPYMGGVPSHPSSEPAEGLLLSCSVEVMLKATCPRMGSPGRTAGISPDSDAHENTPGPAMHSIRGKFKRGQVIEHLYIFSSQAV